MDWLKLEQDLRDVLKSVNRGEIQSGEAVRYIDEFLAAHTRRGNCLDASKKL